MSKFEIGSQWKTRGGHRAFIVGKEPEDDSLIVWCDRGTNTLNIYGEWHSSSRPDDRDLVEPWVEPVVREGWISLFSTGYLCRFDKTKDSGDCPTRIACIPIKFEEGEGL